MSTQNPQKLRQTTATTASISANDISIRSGGTSGTQVSLNSNEVTNLGHHSSTTATKSFTGYHNNFRIDSGNYFGTIGWVDGFLGGTLGSTTVQVISGNLDEGWYWGTTGRAASIKELYRTSGGDLRFTPVIYSPGSSNDGDPITTQTQGWVNLTFRTQNLGGDEVITQSSSYASWNSSTGSWTWNNNIGDDCFGTTGSPTRYVEIN